MSVVRRGFWSAALVAIAVMGFQTCRRALRPEGYDLTAYTDAGAAALHGVSPYGMDVTFPYLYSPCLACLMAPWSWLPAVVAALLWYGLSVFAVVWVVRCVRTWLPPADGHKASLLAVALVAFGLFRLVHSNLLNGQINLILVAMCVASFEAERRDRAVLAGFWLALAVHTKALPILLLGYLLVRGRWRAIAWTAAFGVALALLPVLFWGGETLGIYSAYLDQLQTKIHTGTIGDGAITIASRGDREYFTLRGLVATLVPSTASSVVVKYACLVAVLAGAFVWHVRRRHRRDVAAAAAAFSIWLLAALLISPISEKHHLALAFPAVGLLAVHAARAVADRVAWFLLAGVSGCVLLAKPWPSGPWYLLMIGFALFGAWRATVGDVR